MYRVNTVILFILIISAGFVQAASFEYIDILGIKPDLLLVTVIFFALSCSKDEVIKSSVTAGLIKDITSSSIFGSNAVSFLLVALFLNYHQQKFFKERLSTQVLLSFICCIVTSVSVFLFNLLSYKTLISDYPFLSIVFKGALYTGFISPFVFFALSKLLRINLSPAI